MFSDMKPAEKRLLEACQKGEILDLGKNRPIEKTIDNEIRGKFLRHLILSNNQEIEENSTKYVLKIDPKGIQFSGAYISGIFDFSFCSTDLPFKFKNSIFEKEINLSDSSIRVLNLRESKVFGINAQGLICQGDVFLKDGFESTCKVDFISAQIGASLDCENGKFYYENDRALICNGAKIKGAVFLKNGFEAKGEVNFGSSNIGSLECTGGKFLNEKTALSFNSAKINGMVYLNNSFESNGEIDFISAEILGSLDCGNGKFNSKLFEKALNFEGVKVNKSVFLNDNFEVNGIIDFGYSQIRNTLELSNLKVKGNFILTSAKINIIWIDDNFWEKKDFGNLQLDGLEYNHLSGKSVDSKILLNWFEKMPKEDNFKPQPYKQLAKVLRNMGHYNEAEDVMIEYNNQFIKKDCCLLGFIFKLLYGFTAGYGYKPMRVIFTMFVIWLSCGLFYQKMADVAVFAPSNPLIFQYKEYKVKIADNGTSIEDFFNSENYKCEKKESECNNWTKSQVLQGEYTTFSPYWYSLDILLPIVDLQMNKDWSVFISPINSDITLNHVTRWIMWLEILFGWIFSLILVAILSGLAKNEKD